MYKVFLVEDEIVVRENIRDHDLWDDSDFELVGEAADGEMALPLIEEIRPDILITDIKMPFMDGIELSRAVRRNYPWIKIIIISGYNEFSFAKQAINLAVTDYLLKPLSSKDLLDTLVRVARQIQEETSRREELESLTRFAKDSRHLMAERFLSDLVTGVVPLGDALEKAEMLGIELVNRFFITAVLRLEIREHFDHQQEYSEYIKGEHLIEEFLEANPDILKFSNCLTGIVLIFKGDEAEQVEQVCFSTCQSLKYEIERKTACSLSVDIGSVKERIQGIAESFQDAQTTTRFNYIFGKNRIVGIKDAERANFNSGSLLALNSKAFGEALKFGEKQDLENMLGEYIENVFGLDIGPLYEGFALFELAMVIVRFVAELGGDVDELAADLANLDSALKAGDADTLKNNLLQILGKAYEIREQRKMNRYGDLIVRAKDYIEEHFSDPEISLVALAQHVNVSPSHFSTIFSQETGQTFIEFLTKTRMQKAKEYLKSTSLRSSEIAYKIGYKDPHYFSYIFKSNTGQTPTGFRESKN